MIARYDGEKLTDYVIEGLSESGDSTVFFEQNELFTTTCWVNDGSSIKTDIHGLRKKRKSKIVAKIATLIVRIILVGDITYFHFTIKIYYNILFASLLK